MQNRTIATLKLRFTITSMLHNLIITTSTSQSFTITTLKCLSSSHQFQVNLTVNHHLGCKTLITTLPSQNLYNQHCQPIRINIYTAETLTNTIRQYNHATAIALRYRYPGQFKVHLQSRLWVVEPTWLVGSFTVAHPGLRVVAARSRSLPP